MVLSLTGPQNLRHPLIKMSVGLILVLVTLVISHQRLSRKQRKLINILSYMTFTIISCRQSIVQEGEVPSSHLPGNDDDVNIIAQFKLVIHSQEVAQSLPDTEDPVNQGYR